MFRPVRRKKNEISLEECKSLLAEERRGILAMTGEDGYPYAVPINYYYCQKENKIYFHGARAGYKVACLQQNSKVCFTVNGKEKVKAEAWAPFVQSVVVFGKCRWMENRERTLETLRRFAQKYYPDESLLEEEITRSGNGVQMFEIQIEYMTGKEVQEK